MQDELAKEGLTRIAISPTDASNAVEMEHVAQRTIAQFGGIDILVHSAGTNTHDRAMKRLTTELWDMLVSVNLNGAYYVTHAVLPSMRERGSGHLIYISSISGLDG